MISRYHRFHGYTSLKRVYQNGQSLRGPLIALKFMLNDRRRQYRCAVVVSRKVNKSAVTRNRIRRRIYEVVRLNESNITKPFDIVFIVYSEQLIDMTPKQLEKLIRSLLVQAKIISTSATPSSVL